MPHDMDVATTEKAAHLVAVLVALVTGDEASYMSLRKRFPAYWGAQPRGEWTNYFYHCDGCIGLCVVDDHDVRLLVQEHKLEDYVYFGRNTDPVQVCGIDALVKHMQYTRPLVWGTAHFATGS